MAIRLYKSSNSLGASETMVMPCGKFDNSSEAAKPVKAGDVIGTRLTAGQIGCSIRLSGHAGGQVIAAASGITGIAVHAVATDANGISASLPVPTGVNPQVLPSLGLKSYADRMWTQPPVAGVVRSSMLIYPALPENVFIQRHKKGTRCNQVLNGKVCDLTWNDTTLEWEVDSTTTTLKSIEIVEVPETYADNRSWYDSAGFATDAYGAWVAFKVTDVAQFLNNSTLVRYA